MSAMWQGCLADTDYFEMRSSGGHDYGVWVTTPPGYDPAAAQLRDIHADVFLGFLTAELHPRIERDYSTAARGHGLYGYSYGGLFSLYTWLTGCTLFETWPSTKAPHRTLPPPAPPRLT